MAHKGRLYEVRQSAFFLMGNAPWPRSPAKVYTFDGQIEFFGGGTFDVGPVELSPIDETPMSVDRRWQSSPFDVDGHEIVVTLVLWSPGGFLYCSQVHLLRVDGVEQYEEVNEDFFQSNTYQFVTTEGSLQVPTAGATAGFVGFAQSSAVGY